MEDHKKLLKKVNRKKALYLKQETTTDASFQEEPSPHVFIGNGGLQSGVCREILTHLLSQDGQLDQLYLPTGKDYGFASFTSSETAALVVNRVNGVCVQTAVDGNADLKHYLSPVLVSGPPLHLYLCFVDKIPSEVMKMVSRQPSQSLPPGLILILDYITRDEEAALLDYFTSDTQSSERDTPPLPTSESLSDTSHPVEQSQGVIVQSPEPSLAPLSASLKHRHVKHYGYEFFYGSNNVDPDCPLPGGLPHICRPILKRMVHSGLISEMPDQLTVNQYPPGAGIPPHVDTHSAFKREIISLSLGSQVVMEFRHPDGRKLPVFLPRRSLLVMRDEARYVWSHGIASRKMDEVHAAMAGYQSSPPPATVGGPGSTVMNRRTRVSLTFRKIRERPCQCDCDYPVHCDTMRYYD